MSVKLKKSTLAVLLVVMLVGSFFTGCTVDTPDDANTFLILSASENQTLEPLIQDYAKSKGIKIKMQYKGSVDIMNTLKDSSSKEDAVWAANSIWVSMGDTNHKVKYLQSIMTSPVVFGIKKSKAKELGFIGKNVSVKDILSATEQGKLRFMMTSASQSNSGASAYIGFLYSLLGNPDAITSNDLQKEDLKANIKKLLSGVNRSSGSSGWLKDLFLKGNYDAMVNYESVIIETNKELTKQGREPLYVVYPYDGLTISDSPLGYVDNGDSKKEEIFKGLQEYLLSKDVQSKILALGRRTGIGGAIPNADKSIFNPDWGINTIKTLSPIKYPSTEVIQEALNLYQSEFRKPSYMIFCIDYSGSMQWNNGNKEVKKAMELLLSSSEAKKYMLQLSPNDVVEVIPFSDRVLTKWKASGGDGNELKGLLKNVDDLGPNGGTDIYSPVIEAYKEFKSVDTDKYLPSIVLMTDGQSNTGKDLDDLKKVLGENSKDIPVFSISFGSADDSQLNDISSISSGTTFNGKESLIDAFKHIRGYN